MSASSDFPDAVGIMQRAIKNSIQQYEPRLKNVQVRHIKSDSPTDMILEFEITAQLADGAKSTVRFRTEVSPSGQVTVA